ncbi:MAG: asparagine synthase C-terminal domain-containing protein [Candidatus Hydrothermarchaeales archaeon]
MENIVGELESAITKAIVKETRDIEKFGILFSSGLDSSLLAKICEDLRKRAILYTVGMKESADLKYVKMAKEHFKLPIRVKEIPLGEIGSYAEKVIHAIRDHNPMNVSIGIPLYIACEAAKEEGLKVILSGQGADELFGGYHRYLKMSRDELGKALDKDLEKARRIDIKRDSAIARSNSLELRTPFLDRDVVRVASSLSTDLKIRRGVRKYVLREVAKKRGLPEFIIHKEKKAIQYSTGVDKALRKIAKSKERSLEDCCREIYQQIS